MPNFFVKWRIDIEAETAEEAARLALDMMRDPDSTATVFLVTGDDNETISVDADPLAARRWGAAHAD